MDKSKYKGGNVIYTLIIENQRNHNKYDVSTLANTIEHTTSLSGQPGKLTFILEKDPNNILEICEGNIVTFTIKENNVEYKIFYGYIFILGTDATEAYKITAYDQLRYLKNKDTMTVSGVDDGPMSIVDLFEKICDRNNIPKSNRELKIKDSSYKLKPKLYENETYFSMLEKSIQETLQYSDKNYYFVIRDNFGKLQLSELELEKKNYVIGDGSLLTDYKYEINIDADTYNRIKIMKKDRKNGLTLDRVEQDEKSIAEFGVLQQLVSADNMTENQINFYSKLYLKMKNRPLKSIQLEALGVPDLNAGDGFVFSLGKLNIKNLYMFITEAVHKYEPDLHTMSLQVSGFPMEIPVKIDKNVVLYDVVNGVYGNYPERITKLMEKGGYTYAEAMEIQEQVNVLYDFFHEIVDGKWEGHVTKDGAGSYIIDNQLTSDLYALGVDVELLKLILNSDRFY